MKKLLHILIPLVFCCHIKAQDGCLETSPMYPNATPYQTFVPAFTGYYETISPAVGSGSFSKVQLVAGETYIFSSSLETDFVTIADENGTVVLASGTETVTYESSTNQIIRFYTHLDAECNFDIFETVRGTTVQCGNIQQLENDECAGAIPLTNGSSSSGTTANASDSGGNIYPDVFYSYTTSAEKELVTVSLCGSEYDSHISIYTNCDLSAKIAYNDDSCGLQSEVTFISEGNTTYYILVDGTAIDNWGGNYEISLTTEPYTTTYNCTDHIVPNINAADGYGFLERPAIDIPVGENGLKISGMNIGSFGEATSFSVKIHSDASGVPGTEITATTAQITGEEVLMEVMGLFFMNYTLAFENEIELDPNTIYWLEVESDALGWLFTSEANEVVGRYGLIYRGGWDAIATDFTYELHCEDVLEINDLEKFNFTYYPNPATDILNFKSDKEIKSISVYNLAGQKVLTNAKISNNQLNLSSLPTGNYVFRVELENGQIETFKIVKK